jgi:hypothetical protein
LPPVKLFSSGEIYEILVIYKDSDLVFNPF